MATDDERRRATAAAIAREDAEARASQRYPRASAPRPSPARPVVVDEPAATLNAHTTPPPARSLTDVHRVFRRWLGAEYDLDALHAVLATAAAERLTGDPLWLLVVSGSGNAKTETVQALAGAGALVTSTISSEGALLSGTATRERTKDATGGLLRRLGDRGLLVIKDVTSILSMNRDTRATMLAALREIHDGKWERNVGADGGRSLSWTGRLVVVGAVTTAWDRHHDVIASLGDRFVVVRMDSTEARMAAGRRACRNTGHEVAMRAELAAVVGGLLRTVDPSQAVTLSDRHQERLLQAANVVTLARTGVDYDYRGDVIDAHAPEMPTRFAKQLTQMVRGAVGIGLDRPAALRLALRCARDSMPPLRLKILDDIARFPDSQTRNVRRRLEKPRATIDRQLQSLHMLGVLACDEEEGAHRGKPVTLWRYRLAPGIDPAVLDPTADSVPEKSVAGVLGLEEGSEPDAPVSIPTDFSGTEIDPASADRVPVSGTVRPASAGRSSSPRSSRGLKAEAAPVTWLDQTVPVLSDPTDSSHSSHPHAPVLTDAEERAVAHYTALMEATGLRNADTPPPVAWRPEDDDDLV